MHMTDNGNSEIWLLSAQSTKLTLRYLVAAPEMVTQVDAIATKDAVA